MGDETLKKAESPRFSEIMERVMENAASLQAAYGAVMAERGEQNTAYREKMRLWSRNGRRPDEEPVFGPTPLFEQLVDDDTCNRIDDRCVNAYLVIDIALTHYAEALEMNNVEYMQDAIAALVEFCTERDGKMVQSVGVLNEARESLLSAQDLNMHDAAKANQMAENLQECVDFTHSIIDDAHLLAKELEKKGRDGGSMAR